MAEGTPQIFISYRRGDSGYIASMLCQKLQGTFGQQSVFIDIDNIPFGVDFREHLSEAVARCDILLAIIGNDWLDPLPGKSQRRIDSPTDFVRIELEAALARKIPVVPVLVENAMMPGPDILPDALQPLAYRNAAEIRAGRDLNFHMDTLVRGLQVHFKKAAAKAPTAPAPEVAPTLPPAPEEPTPVPAIPAAVAAPVTAPAPAKAATPTSAPPAHSRAPSRNKIRSRSRYATERIRSRSGSFIKIEHGCKRSQEKEGDGDIDSGDTRNLCRS